MKLNGEKRILCDVTVKSNGPAVKTKKKKTLNKEISFQDFDPGKASERFLIGFDTRGQPNHGPVFAQM